MLWSESRCSIRAIELKRNSGTGSETMPEAFRKKNAEVFWNRYRSENRAAIMKYCRSLQTGAKRWKRAKLLPPAAAMKNMEKAGGIATG